MLFPQLLDKGILCNFFLSKINKIEISQYIVYPFSKTFGFVWLYIDSL